MLRRFRNRVSGGFADLSAKVRIFFGILNRVRLKYLLSAVAVLLFAQALPGVGARLVAGPQNPPDTLPAARPDTLVRQLFDPQPANSSVPATKLQNTRIFFIFQTVWSIAGQM